VVSVAVNVTEKFYEVEENGYKAEAVPKPDFETTRQTVSSITAVPQAIPG